MIGMEEANEGSKSVPDLFGRGARRDSEFLVKRYFVGTVRRDHGKKYTEKIKVRPCVNSTETGPLPATLTAAGVGQSFDPGHVASLHFNAGARAAQIEQFQHDRQQHQRDSAQQQRH
jgi:hypothetical protein